MLARHMFLPVTAAVLIGLTACGSTPAAAPAPVAAPTSSAPTSSAPTSSAPTSPAPAATIAEPPRTTAPAEAPATTRAATTAPKRPAEAPACPSAEALERLADLPADWRFVPSSVECWQGWATADPEGPVPGDGIYLFRHQAGSGWRFHSEGSGYHCEDLGIEEPAPFCQYS